MSGERQRVRRRGRRLSVTSMGVFAAVAIGTGSMAQNATVPGRLDLLSAIVEREIALHHIPGAVVLAGDAKGVIYRRAFGDRILRRSISR